MEKTLGEMEAARKRNEDATDQIKRLKLEIDRLKRSSLVSSSSTPGLLGDPSHAAPALPTDIEKLLKPDALSLDIERLAKVTTPSIDFDKLANLTALNDLAKWAGHSAALHSLTKLAAPSFDLEALTKLAASTAFDTAAKTSSSFTALSKLAELNARTGAGRRERREAASGNSNVGQHRDTDSHKPLGSDTDKPKPG